MALSLVATNEVILGTRTSYAFTTSATLGHTPATGNLVVIAIQRYTAAAMTSEPAGWTHDRTVLSATASHRIDIYSRVITGGEAPSYTWSFPSVNEGACAWEFNPGTELFWAPDTGISYTGNASGVTSQPLGTSAALASATSVAVCAIDHIANTSAFALSGGGTWALVAEPTSKSYHYGSLIASAVTALSVTASWTTSSAIPAAAVQTYYAYSTVTVAKTFTGLLNVNGTVAKAFTGLLNVGGRIAKTFTGLLNVNGPLGPFTIETEVAWGNTPLDTPTALEWSPLTNVGKGIRNPHVTRGSKILSSQLQTGEATVVAENSQRHLDPAFAASNLAPNVKPRRRIRHILRTGPASIKLHTGFIERYTPKWIRNAAYMTIPSQDLLGILSDVTLPLSVIEVVTRSLGARNYYPMGEDPTAGLADDVIGTSDGTYVGPVGTGGKLVPFDPRSAPKFPRPQVAGYGTVAMAVYPWTTPDDFSVSMWFQWTVAKWVAVAPTMFTTQTGSVPTTFPAGDTYNPSPAGIAVYLGTTSSFPNGERMILYFRIQDGTHVAFGYAAVAYAVMDGKPHQVGFSCDASAKQLYTVIDGTRNLVSDAGFTGSANIVNLSAINWSTVAAATTCAGIGWGIRWQDSVGDASDALIGNYAFFPRVLTAAEWLELYNAGTNPWDGDTTDQRLNRVLDLAGVSAADRDIAVGTQICGPTMLGGQNLKGYAEKIVRTEAGVGYVNGDGQVAFRPRPSSPVPVETFSDNPLVDGGIPCSPVAPDNPYDRLVNSLTVVRENGAEQLVQDAASVAQFGELSGAVAGGKLETLHASADDARATAQFIIDAHKNPVTYIPAITVRSSDRGVSVHALTGIDVGDLVAVRVRPPGYVDEVLSIAAQVENITYSCPTPTELVVTYTLGDGVPYTP